MISHKLRDRETVSLLLNADRLREARRQAGYTQEQLGVMVGTSGQMISLLENGGRRASQSLVVQLGESLGLDPDELVLEKEPLRRVDPTKVLVGTAVVVRLRNSTGVLNKLSSLVADERISIRSLSTDADSKGTGTITMVIDPVVGVARERLRLRIEAMPGVRECELRNLKQPMAEVASSVMPVTSHGECPAGLRLVPVGLPGSANTVSLTVLGQDRVGLMAALTDVISNRERLDISAAGSSVSGKEAVVWFLFEPGDDTDREELIEALRDIESVDHILISEMRS